MVDLDEPAERLVVGDLGRPRCYPNALGGATPVVLTHAAMVSAVKLDALTIAVVVVRELLRRTF